MSFCLHYSSFIAFSRVSILCILNHNFDDKMTLNNKNNLPFPSLRTFHLCFVNFIIFGCGWVLCHFGSVSRFVVPEVRRFQKSPKLTWCTRDEIKVKISYLLGYLKVVLHAPFEFGSENLISWALNIDFDSEMTPGGKKNLAFSFPRPC